MCMACEMGFWNMIDALPADVRERILREQEQAARFACEAPAQEPAADAPPAAQQPGADERKP